MIKKDVILAIESSCDDTSVALINTDFEILVQLTSTQKEHINFGGVLPELASRLHLRNLIVLVEAVLIQSGITLKDISAIAVSINPGLIGSLIVGLSFAKSLAWTANKPLITVNHMLGHVFANHIAHKSISPPYLALVVSGGHTELVYIKAYSEIDVIGKTLDDAAGETFDKVAKLLKLGFPGGPIIDKLSEQGDPDMFVFPQALKQKDNYSFSYSGLKTSVKQFISTKNDDFVELYKPDIAASVQKAIVEPLVKKTVRYAETHEIKQILLCGGVAANSLLRKMMHEKVTATGIDLYYPPLHLCMDNAAMIAAAAIPKFFSKQFSSLSINAFSDKGVRHL